MIFVWILGGAMALTGALTFAELGVLKPHAGGVYVFIRDGFGKLPAFLYGWGQFFVINTGSIAALSIAFATYFGFFFPLSPVGVKLVAISGLAVVTLVNYFGAKSGGIFSDIFTMLKLAGIFSVIFAGLWWGSGANVHFNFSYSTANSGNFMNALALGMVGVLWSYGGWIHSTMTAGEAIDPVRSLPRAIIVGTVLVIFIYISINLAYMWVLPISDIASSSRVAADAMTKILGSAGGAFISIAIFVSTFGTTGIYTLTVPRIYYVMAKDGVFFELASRLHPKYASPTYAIVFQSLWSVVLILLWGTFTKLITYVAFTDWIFYALSAASLFVFRKNKVANPSRYRTPFYPFTPAFFVLVASWFVLNTFVAAFWQAAAGLGILCLGVPVFYFWSNKNKKKVEG
jgi:APA family basic amino acid/polyamine antiporter